MTLFLSILLAVLLLLLVGGYICFRMAFYVSTKRKKSGVSLELPNAEEYKIYDEKIAICSALKENYTIIIESRELFILMQTLWQYIWDISEEP